MYVKTREKPQENPFELRVITQSKEYESLVKYAYDGDTYSLTGKEISKFVKKVTAGEVKPMMKSKKIEKPAFG